MLKRIKKILFVNILVCLLLVNIRFVSAYEFVKDENAYYVYRDRRAIHDLVQLYYDIVGVGKGNYIISNYSGVCGTVTVSGNDAGTYKLEDYVAGVVKAEMGAEHDKPEALKAQAVAARSFLIASKENSGNCTVGNSQSFQAFRRVDPSNSTDQKYIAAAEQTAGQVVMRNGEVALTQYLSYPNAKFHEEKNGQWHVRLMKFSNDSGTSWTWVGPSKNTVVNANNYKPSSGAPSTTHHWGMSQIIAGYLASTGQNYQQILTTFYGTPQTSIEAMTDGSYVGDVEFVDSEFGNIRYFNQGDYSSYYYSSNVSQIQYRRSDGSGATIASHGCGPTSLAIIFSTFAGRDITPITVTQEVCQAGGCTSSGTYYGHLKTIAERYGYRAETVRRDNSGKVIEALSSGNALVIAYMGPGRFTSGGHYMVLTGTRKDGNVSVADPGSRQHTTTKWHSFNLIVEQASTNVNDPFLIIYKR